MFSIALGLSAANIILLAMAFTIGLSALDVESGAMTVYSTHIAIGIACGLMCALTHVAIFTYFMATSKWLQAAVDKGGMQHNDFVAPSLSRKIRVLASGLVAIGGTLAAMIGGAGCDPTVNILWPAEIHLALAISAIIINIIVALIELRLVSDQGKLIDKALILLNTLPTSQPSTAQMKSLVPLIFMLVFAGLGCRLDASTPLPNQVPSSTTAEQWLGIIEKRLEGTKSIVADLQLEKVEGIGVLDEKEIRKGRIVFATGPPAKFSIHLVQLLIDRRPQKQNQWYIFDGRWLVDRDDNEKIFTKREIVPPDKTASDPLADGDGPFFLPITARKDLILKHFDVSIISPNKKDPANSIHMRMTPKPTRRTEVKQIDVWYHSITCIPIRASTLDDGPNRQTVELSNVKLNEKVDLKILDVSVPKGKGWHKTVEPYPHH